MQTDSNEAGGRRARERSLVRALIAGSERAFDELADDYIPALYRFALSRLRGDEDLAGELVQTTLVKVMAKLGTFRGDAALLTWLCAYCKTEIASHFRRRGRRPAEVELTDERASVAVFPGSATPDGPEESVLREDASRLVHAALDRLAPRQARVLEWKYLEGLPVKEIASRMALSPKAAESLLTRARDSFRDAYERLQTGSGHE